jgi:hypothetical protein
MESVFYAKRRKDTTFFNRLATKKMKRNACSILVRFLNKRLLPVLINMRHAQQ